LEGKPIVRTNCHCLSKFIKISHTWRRAKLGLDWFAWQLHSW